MAWKPMKSVEKAVATAQQDIKSGPTAAGFARPVTELGSDISKASKAAGESISNAAKVTGSSIADAYHTSVVDPLKKAGADAKNLLNKWSGKLEDLFKGSGQGGAGIPEVSVPTPPTGYGGGGGLGGGGGTPSTPVQIQALSKDMQGLLGTDRFGTQQQTLAGQLAAQAAGQGPSLATDQFKQAQQANVAAQMAALASARGGASPALARQTMQSAQQIQAQTARDAALARIQEQMGAREQLAGVLSSGRAGDIERAGQGQQMAIQQAQLGQQGRELSQQAAQQAAQLQAQYQQMGLDAQQANQMAAIYMAQIQAGQPSNLAVGANVLSGLLGAFK